MGSGIAFSVPCAQNRLRHLIDTIAYGTSGADAAAALQSAIADANTAIDQMTVIKTEADHYGG